MGHLSTFRAHCEQMATAAHRPDCPTLTAKKPHWQSWALTSDGKGMVWRGPEPRWEPPTCDGCNPESNRALFAQMAAEVECYEQGTLR